MSEIKSDLSPSQLVPAIETNFYDFWTYLGRSPRVELYDSPDMIRFTSDVPSPICNNVLRAKLSAKTIGARIDDTVTHFRSRELPLRWMVSPSSRPGDLSNHLQAHGFIYSGYAAGMAANLHELSEVSKAPSDLKVEHVVDVNRLEQMMQAFTIGYGIHPNVGNLLFDVLRYLGFDLPLRHYIGLLRGKPVACSTLFLSSGVAGVFIVATVEQARGMGIGSSLTLQPLLEARDLGYRIGVLGASEMGAGMYRRLGFRDYFKFDIFILDSGTPLRE